METHPQRSLQNCLAGSCGTMKGAALKALSQRPGSTRSTSAPAFLLQSFLRHWPSYVLGICTLLITSLSEVLTPKFIEWSIDTVTLALTPNKLDTVPSLFRAATPQATLSRLGLGLCALLFIGLLGRIGWRQILARRTHVAGRELKASMWDVLRHLPLRTLQNYPLGDLMNRAIGDWNAARSIYGFTVVSTFDLIFLTCLSIFFMLRINVELTLCCLLVFPVLPRFIARLARKQHDLHIWAQEKLGDLSDHISQCLGTIRLQRATATDTQWQVNLARESREYADRRYQVIKTGWRIFPLGALPTLIAYGILLSLGVRKIAMGELSIGGFVAMQSYLLMLQTPMSELGDCIAEWQKGFASLDRILEIFGLRTQGDQQLAKKALPQSQAEYLIKIPDLVYGYEDVQERAVLRGLNLQIKRGESIGIFGPIGAGKSTLLRLISGLTEPPAGKIYLGGVDASTVDRSWMADHIAFVPQRAFLFAGTIRYNLELNATYTEEQLWQVLRLVSLEEDVQNFTRGLDTWIGEWGVTLSGGQKQRLSFARALLRNAQSIVCSKRDGTESSSILLLDDCLSAVDSLTEEKILGSLQQPEPCAGADLSVLTLIWVAHRPSTLRLCDRVYYLKEGRLELMDKQAYPDASAGTNKSEMPLRQPKSANTSPQELL